MRAEDLVQGAHHVVDEVEPRLRALVDEPDRRGRLLAEVQRQDRALKPFIVGIKDIVNVAGIETRAGSDLPAELFDGPEATVVTRLRAAGGIVLAKTTTTEFAFSEPAPTTNPHNELHTPGGSSSGSAAAVAAGYTRLAIGTQTVDSIVTPASYCGVVGFKPSYGRVPVDGVLELAPAMDHVGVLAHDVNTTEFAASIICDGWRGKLQPGLPVVGLPDPAFLDLVDTATRAAFDRTVATLEASGCHVIASGVLADITVIARRHRRLIAVQFASVHRDWFARYGDRYRPRTAALFAEGESLDPSAVQEGLAGSFELRSKLDETMDDLGIDVWMSPATTGPAPRGLDSVGDPIMGVPWTHAHLPVICLPSAMSPDGLPLGIQLTGRPGGDEALLGFARSLEHALGVTWKSPEP